MQTGQLSPSQQPALSLPEQENPETAYSHPEEPESISAEEEEVVLRLKGSIRRKENKGRQGPERVASSSRVSEPAPVGSEIKHVEPPVPLMTGNFREMGLNPPSRERDQEQKVEAYQHKGEVEKRRELDAEGSRRVQKGRERES